MTVESPPAIKTPVKRLDHIQALRGVAALMVVVSHLLIIERKYSVDQILGDWAVYGMAGVDLFFVISGFIMVYVMWDRPRGIKAAGEFLWGRASRIYPLYWVISLLLLALWLVRPDMVFSSIDAPPDIVKSFALFPDDREPLLAVGWTLVHEMYFYLVFAVIMLLPRGWLFPSLVLWMSVIFAGEFFSVIALSENTVIKIVFSPLTHEFILGAGAAFIFKLSHEHDPTPVRRRWIVFIILFALMSFTNAIKDAEFPLDEVERVDDFFIFATLMVYGCVAMDFRKIKVWKPLVTLGDWSYSLYLTHVLSLTVMGRLWSKFSSDTRIDNVVILLFMVAVTIAVSGLIYHYIEAPMIKAARKMRRRLFKTSPV